MTNLAKLTVKIKHSLLTKVEKISVILQNITLFMAIYNCKIHKKYF